MKTSLINRAKIGKNSNERLSLVREELHHILLQETDRLGYFSDLCFLGGTALRILYGLDRFSEDLDFSTSAQLKESFDIKKFSEKLSLSLNSFGLECQVNKLKTVKTVRSCFFVFSNILNAVDPYFQKSEKLAIKWEVDTNPPKGAHEELSPVTGARVYKVRHYDISSLFAGKLHALLFRQYTKGRDLHDFLWYLGKKVPVNALFLENATLQTQGTKISFTKEKLQETLTKKFNTIDFKKAKQEMIPFLIDPRSIDLFEKELFLSAVKKLEALP